MASIFDSKKSSTDSEPIGTPVAQSLGALLRERRETLGVSLSETEEAIRIRQKYLAAIESDEWHLLPGEVVGRGFLRNYAEFLGVDPLEMVDRRRSLADRNLVSSLSTTSAGAPLPPDREVDYRPKDLDLKDELEGIEQGERRVAPIFLFVVVAMLAVLGWWGYNQSGDTGSTGSVADSLGTLVGNVQTGLSDILPDQNEAPPTAGVGTPIADTAINDITTGSSATDNVAANSDIQNNGTQEDPQSSGGQNSAGSSGNNFGTGGNDEDGSSNTPAVAAVINTPTHTPEPLPTDTAEPLPTDTPVPPTDTPEPLPTDTPEPLPTDTPIPLPTDTPEPLPPTPTPVPVVAAASCPDPRSVISSPGVNQVVAGVIGIDGTATHENFNFYKLEYAPGASAEGGYAWFDGTSNQVSGGRLGSLNTAALANGTYTIQLAVVDQTGNFPPPCRVTITIQN